MTTRIGICFFGITRSVSYTVESIDKNVYQPLKKFNVEVKKFGHFFEQKQVVNTRSGEVGALNSNEAKLLGLDYLEFEQPDYFLSASSFEEVKQFGDFWQDSNQSIRNLYHQLYSMKAVTEECLEWQPDIVIFLRPDLKYHDDFSKVLKKALKKAQTNHLFIPNWQHFEGVNDRFAIAVGRKAIEDYGLRFSKISDFCKAYNSPLHSERLVKYAISAQHVTFVPLRGSRVRVNGVVVEELFLHYRTMLFSKWLDRLDFFEKEKNSKLVWLFQKITYGNPYKKI